MLCCHLLLGGRLARDQEKTHCLEQKDGAQLLPEIHAPKEWPGSEQSIAQSPYNGEDLEREKCVKF